MKKNKLFIIIGLCSVLCTLYSCSDKVYEDLNTDLTKADHINPASQLTYAELQIYGDMNYVDVHRLYTYAFTQHLMGCWNTTNYGGQHRMDDQEMGRPWNNLYPAAIRNLTDAIEQTKNDPEQVNIHAALRIFRVYVGSLLTDFYGDVPFLEAGMGYISGITQPKYDTQQELYTYFFQELKEAADLFDIQASGITSDPMFNGNIESWKTFANSLRLRYAMRLSEVDPTMAQQEFQAALADGVMSSASDDACVKHMNVSYSFGQESYKDFRGNAMAKYFFGNDPANNPTYICSTFWKQLYDNNDPRTTLLCRFYIDDFMSLTTGEGRIDMTDAVMETQNANPGSQVVSMTAPGEFSWDNWPTYSNTTAATGVLAAKIAEVQASHPKYNPDKNSRWLKPKLANNFLKSDNPGVIMTYAEVCFLRAEAAVNGWTGDNAKQMYEAGIRAAMDFLADNYGCAYISDAAYAAYLTQPSIAYDAAEAKKQINTQAWILHFHNPAEAWANVRRSNYPQLTPPSPGGKNPLIDGDEIPVRFCYPLKEETYSKDAYEAAKARVANYGWHAPLWWDVN